MEDMHHLRCSKLLRENLVLVAYRADSLKVLQGITLAL